MAFIPQSGSVVSFQSNSSVLQTLTGLMSTNASVITVGTTNQSVSGTIQADIRGSVATVIIGGSIAASFTPPANQSVSGTVQVELLSTSASVITVGSPVANQSVSGTVNVGNFPTTQNVSGSVVAFQGTSPWVVSQNGSIAAVIVSGSIATTTGNSSVQVLNFPANQSVSGTVGTTQQGTWISSIVNTVPSSVLVGASIFGQLPAGTAMMGSVVAYQGAVWNTAGSVVAIQSGTWSTSVMTNVITSIATAGQVMGSVAVLQGTALWNISGSVAARLTTSTNSSVIVVWPAPSIVGTYQEDAAHTTADRGLFTLAVRNDTVASFAGANREYSAFATDSAGRTINKPFAAGEASIMISTSLVSAGTTASVAVFPAPGAGLRNYITDFNISNTSATTTIVRFGDRDRSVLAQTIAPGGGGSNHSYTTPVTSPTANLATGVEILTSASVVYVTVSGFKAP